MDHLTSADWTAYRQRTLSAADLLAVSDHLAACPQCAAQRENTAAPTAEIDDLPFDDPYEDLAAWVDGTMTDPVDREIFEARLRIDPPLHAAVNDLAAFKSALDRLPPPNVVPFRPSHWLLPLAAAATVMLTVGLSTALQPLQHSDFAEVVLPPLAPELKTVRGTLAGETEEPGLRIAAPLAPIVRERQPRLAWTSRDPAEGFVVHLERLSSGALLSSPPLPAAARSWQPPAPLVPGAIYEWQVQAMQGGAAVDQAPKPPEPEARFQVLDAAAEKALREATGSELSIGMAYARAGLVQEADAHWRAAGPAGERLRAKLRDAAKQAGYLR